MGSNKVDQIITKPNTINDFESFKQQYNLKDILDKLVIKREFFIPSKATNINEYYEFIKVSFFVKKWY